MNLNHHKYISRCLELAQLGKGNVSPNPMVGAVIVNNDEIIGEGYHEIYGGPHAEVNAINSVNNIELLKKSIIYVSLEPCSHYGKTPPCADLIIAHKIPEVVIASLDTNPVVCGNGVRKLKEAGVNVISGILDSESRQMNKAFNKFQKTKAPFVTLKWAQTSNGFIDHQRNAINQSALKISNATSSTWVHKLRAEMDAILVGKNTVLNDNPSLTTRKWKGSNPIRVIIDSNLELGPNLTVFNDHVPTLVLNQHKTDQNGNIEWIKVNTKNLRSVLQELGKKHIQSVLVEGGSTILQSFIDEKLYDECIVISSTKSIESGIKAPSIKSAIIKEFNLGNNQIKFYE